MIDPTLNSIAMSIHAVLIIGLSIWLGRTNRRLDEIERKMR